MGIQITGSNDTIQAADGNLSIEGVSLNFNHENVTGISTMATGHITGTATIDDDLKVGISTLFVDVSAGRIGINTDVPDFVQHNYHKTDNVLALFESGDEAALISFQDNNSTNNTQVWLGAQTNDLRFAAGGSEAARIASTGNLLVGADAVEDWDGSRDHRIQVRGNTYQTAGISILDTQNDDNPCELLLGKSRGTGNTIVGSADDVGQVRWAANDGAGFHSIAWIRGSMDGTPGSDDLPSKLTFGTSADGGTTVIERLRITSAGDLKHTGRSAGDETNKLALLVVPSHDTNEEDVIIYQVENESTFNQLSIGGGTGSYNAATTLRFLTASAVDTTGGTERIQIKSTGQILYSAASGDNTITSKRTNAAGSNGNYFFHLAASDNNDNIVGSLGFHRDTAVDDSRFVLFTRKTGGSNTERLTIKSDGKIGINDTTPSAYLDITQGGIDSDVPGINIFMNGVGAGTVGPQYGLKITGGGYNNADHIYGIYVDKTAQLTQQNTAAYHKMAGVYNTLYGTQSIVNCTDTGATGTVYGVYASAQGNSGSAKNKVGYGIWAESTGTNFNLANAARFKTVAGATLTYGIIYVHDSTEVFRVAANGDVYSATNSYTSDRDLKENITTISGTSLDKIKQLVPKTFKWKLDDRHAEIDSTLTAPTNTLTGLIAQEVKPILPDIVTGTDGQKDMGINYNGLSAHLVNAVKELSAENEAMRSRLDALESA